MRIAQGFSLYTFWKRFLNEQYFQFIWGRFRLLIGEQPIYTADWSQLRFTPKAINRAARFEHQLCQAFIETFTNETSWTLVKNNCY